jgi:hypothetical protein
MEKNNKESMIENLRKFIENKELNSYITLYNEEVFLLLESTTENEIIEEYMLKTFNISHLWDIIESGYSDEYFTCHNCNKVMHNDDGNFIITKWELLCTDCIDIDIIIEEYTNEPKKALTDKITSIELLTNEGFIDLDKTYENGLYEGMNDEPEKILNDLNKKYNEVIFFINANNTFMVEFTVLVRSKIEE